MSTEEDFSFVKLRDRFQMAGLPDEYAQKALIIVMEWLAEASSLGNRSRRPEAAAVRQALEEEEEEILPPENHAPENFAEVAAKLVDKPVRPPRTVRAAASRPLTPPPSN